MIGELLNEVMGVAELALLFLLSSHFGSRFASAEEPLRCVHGES